MHATQLKDKTITRRSFLGWLAKASLTGAAMLGIGSLLRYLGYSSGDSLPTQQDLGLASNYPLGSRTVVASAQAIIIHDEQGYHALSLVCPHLGCVVNVDKEGFACPCHGSRFLADGSLHNGPASRPLASLRIEQDSQEHLVLFMK